MNEYVTTEAVLLRESPFKGSSIVATFYTEARGVVPVICHGARKEGGKFGSDLRATGILRVILRATRDDFFTLTESALIEEYPGIRASFMKSAALSYTHELVLIANQEPIAEPRYLSFLRAYYKALENAEENARAIAYLLRACEVKTLYIAGIFPNLGVCARCDASLADDAYYSPEQGGAVCPGCVTQSERSMPLSPALRETVTFLLHHPLRDACTLEIEDETYLTLKRVFAKTLSIFFGRRVKSANVVDDLLPYP